jgi:type II secretory ATPase GspE/PulE/Tfp pilus assembly ATPase PilB-like protein
MRDAETAAVAVSAALSGQLVMTSLHANDALGAIERLAELGIARGTIAACCTAIVAQRLVRLLCRHCRGMHCEHCNGTGYRGRTAIFESLFFDPEIQDAISAGDSTSVLARTAKASGYEPLQEDALARVSCGQTSLEEVQRVLSLRGFV